ncbi:MAG: hypothetical protein ACRDZR_06210 [Acidimicrobiales bacterium]
MPKSSASTVPRRAEEVLRGVLPPTVVVTVRHDAAGLVASVGGTPLRVAWGGEGWTRDIRPLVAGDADRPDVVVARRVSPGARELLAQAGVGWADETGAAEIALGTLVVSRAGRPEPPRERPARWTRGVLAVAEALLCGVRPTVKATAEATGLSAGSCTHALQVLQELDLVQATVARGPDSGRTVEDRRALLTAYAAAATALRPPVSLRVGVSWRDPVEGLRRIGTVWERAHMPWAATGAAAASLLAPYQTSVTTTEVYVGVETPVGLEVAAHTAELRPIEGGRVVLRPFPTVAVHRLAGRVEGVAVAPWPRVYADLRPTGVRGEEAAEHLAEVNGVG